MHGLVLIQLLGSCNTMKFHMYRLMRKRSGLTRITILSSKAFIARKYAVLLGILLTCAIFSKYGFDLKGKLEKYIFLYRLLHLPVSSGSSAVERLMSQKRMYYNQQTNAFFLQSSNSVRYFQNLSEYRTWIQKEIAEKADNHHLKDLKVVAIQGQRKSRHICDQIGSSSEPHNDDKSQHSITRELVPAEAGSNLIQLLLQNQGLMVSKYEWILDIHASNIIYG